MQSLTLQEKENYPILKQKLITTFKMTTNERKQVAIDELQKLQFVPNITSISDYLLNYNPYSKRLKIF